MAVTPQDMLAFWKAFAAALKGRIALQPALEKAALLVQATSSEAVARKLINDVSDGQGLFDAMSQQEHAFSRCVLAMIHAAEMGGVTDTAADRIARGIEDGSLPAIAVMPLRQDEPVKFWRASGWLLSAGVPLLKTVELLGQEVAGPELRKACIEIRQGITAHKPLATILAQMPELFVPDIVQAVREAQAAGTLDEAAFRIADALQTGDLSALAQAAKPPFAAAAAQIPARATPADDDAQVVQLADQMLSEAVAARASDIHMDPVLETPAASRGPVGGEGGRIRFRIDGVLQEWKNPAPDKFGELVLRVKSMAGMDAAQQKLPQVGQMIIESYNDYVILASTLPTLCGERLVLRLLSRRVSQAFLDLPRVVPRADDLATIRNLCRLGSGMVLVTGPAGSGKTTLAYAMLQEMDTAGCCVLTIEDPVEYLLPGVAQVQIRPAEGLTYSRALRAVYRQDLDVAYVGEVLDLETLTLMAKLVTTGHLVLSQLHTNTPAQTLARLLELGMEPFLINATLKAIASQRLLRLLCPHCRKPSQVALHSLPPAMAQYVASHAGATFYGPAGCEKCHNTGYAGRMAVQEILLPDDRLRQVLTKSPALAEIQQAARETGMVEMVTKALDVAAEGQTSLEEVMNLALAVAM